MPIRFDYDTARAANAVLWLLSSHGGRLNQGKLMKLVFFADRRHLELYGRPIVGGNYVALENGPVTKELHRQFKTADAKLAAFHREGDTVVANGSYDEAELSQSDLEVLQEIDREIGN